MSLSGQEKMKVLLEQIKLPENIVASYFQSSQIVKLTVYRETKRWHFTFEVERILPIEVYRTFLDHLRETFHHLATVKVTIHVNDESCDKQTIEQYWEYFITQIGRASCRERE